MIKRSEKLRQQRLDDVAMLKKRKNLLSRLTLLQGNEGWATLKETLGEMIKAQDRTMEASLGGEESIESYHRGRIAYAIKKAFQHEIELVENPQNRIAEIDESIRSLTEKIAEADADNK